MRKSLILLAVLIVLAPVFAYAAELVGYSEPLENVAASLGVEEGVSFYRGVMPDYTVRGLDPYLGSLVSAVVGSVLAFLVVYGVARVMRR